MDKLTKLTERTKLYWEWRWCETGSKDAWKKEECKKLYEVYYKACLKKGVRQ